MNYKKIIQENKENFNDTELLINFIDTYVSDTRTVTELEEYISEYADNEVPIYNNDRATKWIAIPEAQDLTLEYEGEYPKDASIFEMMGIDLLYYYQDILVTDYQAFIKIIN